MSNYSWVCSTCGHHTTVTEPNYDFARAELLATATKQGKGIVISGRLFECPNQSCKAQEVKVFVEYANWVDTPSGKLIDHSAGKNGPVGIGKFTFLPVAPQPLSSSVPRHISEDYSEAHLIKDLSPKASATLARRALQGMVRDFFKLGKLKSLHHELEAIRDRCDPELYQAMMAVKSIGNIGAHPERDVSLMVDVESGEAELLLKLIHLLDQDWYVAREQRALRISQVKALGNKPEQARTVSAIQQVSTPKKLDDTSHDGE